MKPTYYIDINGIREEFSKKIRELISLIKDESLTYDQKLSKVLSDISSEEYCINPEEKIEKEYLNSFEGSTKDISTGEEDNCQKLDPYKAKIYLINNLFDLTTAMENLKLPKKYEIQEGEKYCYLYPDKIITYSLAESGLIANKRGKPPQKIDYIKEDKSFDSSVGFYFCGKKIEELKDESFICAKDCFMCKDCMKKNKKLYKIEDGGKNMINIYGRISRRNKQKYYCYGHFQKSGIIKDCGDEYSCEGCKILEKYAKYFT